MPRRNWGFAIAALAVMIPSAVFCSSLFSAWGLGEIVEGTNPRARSLGGLALALPSEGRSSFLNPASHTTLPTTSFGMSLAPEVTWVESDEGHNRLVTTSLPTVEMALPFGSHTAGWLGLRQVTAVEYTAVRQDSIEEEHYRRELSREGGLHCVAAGLAWGGAGWVSVGAEARFLFGQIVERRILDFSNNLYDDTEDEQTSTYRGTTWRLGVLFRPHSKVSLGAVLGTPRELRVSYKATNTLGVERSWSGTLAYPASLGAGVAVSPWGPITVSADWWETRWGATRFEETDQTFHNTTAVGIGLEVKASRAERRGFLRQFPLRLGYAHLPWYTGEEGEPRPDEFRYSFGTSIPLLGRRGLVDITVELGRREASGIKEKLFRLQLGVVGFERWARKYE